MEPRIEVKHAKFFKSKKQMIIYIILLLILMYLFILVGTHDYTEHDSSRLFSKEYTLVGDDNVFAYSSIIDVHMIAAGKKGIVFFGNAQSKWSQYYASIINDAAKASGIDKIDYYDFYSDREQHNATYEDTLLLLKDYVTYNDLGKANFYAPSLLVVNDGKVITFDTETSFIKGKIEPKDYWTEEKRKEKEQELQMYFLEYLGVI